MIVTENTKVIIRKIVEIQNLVAMKVASHESWVMTKKGPIVRNNLFEIKCLIIEIFIYQRLREN